jgi:hypothetical protein
MSTLEAYPRSGRFTITATGREDLRVVDTCACVQVVDAGMIVCRECGTVYGLLRQSAFAVSSGRIKKVMDA